MPRATLLPVEISLPGVATALPRGVTLQPGRTAQLLRRAAPLPGGHSATEGKATAKGGPTAGIHATAEDHPTARGNTVTRGGADAWRDKPATGRGNPAIRRSSAAVRGNTANWADTTAGGTSAPALGLAVTRGWAKEQDPVPGGDLATERSCTTGRSPASEGNGSA